MKQSEAEELLALLPRERTLFTYGKDWYAVALLQLALRRGHGARPAAFAKLYDKPRLRAWLGAFGKKSFSAMDLDLLWPEESETYRLTAGLFSGWAQTSRKGGKSWNIVLQMNLNGDDARLMETKFPERSEDPFECSIHPIHEGRHRTLAWARIDLDWRTGEALIEEIQNDRIRDVEWRVNRIRTQKLRTIRLMGREVEAEFVIDYWERRLRLSRQCWDEAMLCAAIRFIVVELGLRKIYYHSPVSGKYLKRAGNAPTSIYTDLPRKFCFEKTTEMPEFLGRCGKRRRDLWMHRLCF